jgi:signal transduction histidine kinase
VVSFVLVAGLSAAALALGSFLLVRQSRLDDSVDRSVAQARLNLAFAGQNLPARPTPQSAASLLGFYEGGGFDTLILSGPTPLGSSPLGLTEADVPAALRETVGRGNLAWERGREAGQPVLVVGSPAGAGRVSLYFFFSERRLHDDLRQLGLILLAWWGVAVVLAAGAGLLVARRTLGPVARASAAAHSIAEGLLHTRLPVEGRDEFGAWAASFNEMAEALEDKIAALSEARERERRFTADVAHELRTPLTALVSEASLLREHVDRMPAEARRPAELLVDDVARLRRLVEDLMEVSRLDAGREEVRLEKLDLGTLVAATLRTRGWSDRVAMASDEVSVASDRRRLERIVTNLVGNALEHGGRDVAVRVGRDDGDVFVEVSDRGPGIGPDELPLVFDRFYKADRSRTGPGSGLGLAIAREHARLLGGDVEVWSEPGRGSRFTLRLTVTEPLPDGDPGVSSGAEDEAVPTGEEVQP